MSLPLGPASKQESPEYAHDCVRCTFLGRHLFTDLYFCDQLSTSRYGRQTTRPTIVARHSDAPEGYISGLPRTFGADAPDVIVEGYERAVSLGLLKPES